MLRNIPNRINHESLKDLLDQTSRGKYDFMYLRIDFANNCNVGYAFINFVDPMDIVPFATKHAGKKWNLFHSEKVAEVSYASKFVAFSAAVWFPGLMTLTAIQGRDCLIQKFRNSSVMLEQKDFRPKVCQECPVVKLLLTVRSFTEQAMAQKPVLRNLFQKQTMLPSSSDHVIMLNTLVCIP